VPEQARISGTVGRLLPWAILAIGMAVTAAAWRMIAAHEHVEIGWATRLAGDAIATDIREDMEWQRVGLDRLGLLLEAADSPQQLWKSNAELYIQHRPGCIAVEWLGPNGDKRLVVTHNGATTPLAFDGQPHGALEAAKRSGNAVFSMPAAVARGGVQYAIAFPVYANDQLRGFVVSFFDSGRSIDENLSDVRGLGFSFAVVLPGQPEYLLPGMNRENEQHWAQTLDVPLPGVTWHLRVWPNPDALYRIRSALPEATLIVGALLSLLASLTAYFGVAVGRSSTRIRLANEALQKEIAVREGADRELRLARDELDKRVHERTSELAAANILLNKEIADHKQSEDALRELTARLFQWQDDERRRLARELHDGAVQNLVALSMTMGMIREAIPADHIGGQEMLKEAARLIGQATNELRTISYLLHPPYFDELGLISALRDYVDGFAARSGIQVTLEIEPSLGRLGHDAEITIFRVVQEALSNIHRHAHSRTADIRLLRRADLVQLEIADVGRGIPPEILGPDSSRFGGVGIAGMRERVRLLGGRLQIQSSGTGTRIQAVLPLTTSDPSMRKTVSSDASAAAARSSVSAA
jgi:signal transduction histidine kinase